jgi:hypothetical protein
MREQSPCLSECPVLPDLTSPLPIFGEVKNQQLYPFSKGLASTIV